MNVPARRGPPALLALTVALALALACTGGSEEGGVAPAAAPATAAPAAATPTATVTPSPTPAATPTATPSPTPAATPTAAPSPAPTPDAEPTKLRYNILDTTGAAATAGSYAFLTTAGDATSAIENFGYLPGGGVELRIHRADASGASRSAFYDTVQVGDTFDYRTNGLDCGFRFKVTSLGATATPRTLGIERLRRYGTRCGDAVDNPGAPRDVDFVWRVRTGIPGADGVRVMVVDEPTGPGTYRIARDVPWVIDIPAGAEIVFEGFLINRPVVGSNLPGTTAVLRDVGTGSRLHIDPETGRDVYRFITSDEADTLFDQIVASIRRVEVGATPATTPAVCTTPADPTCIRAVYKGAPADYAQVSDVPADRLLTPGSDGRYRVERGQQYTVVTAAPLPAGWTRFWLDWSPLEFGTPSPVSFSQLIKPVGTTYTFTVTDDETASTLITFDLKQARPFVRPRPDGKPEIGATVVTTVFSVETTSPRYSSYDSTGAVATAGSYAFLADPADTTSAVSTYEALRDGTTTALLIHKSDAHGASQAALYDAVEAGELFEWHEADDCFVRYKVTEVKPDPAGTVPRKLLAVEWMTYAFTGCSGAVSADVDITIGWAPPPVNSPDITSPIRHGPFLLIPSRWDGAVEDQQAVPLSPTPGTMPENPNDPIPTWPSTDIAEIRRHPLWNEPDTPEGWTLFYAEAQSYGITLRYHDGVGHLEIQVSRASLLPIYNRHIETSPYGGRIHEAAEISGRPAILWYTPTNDSGLNVTVQVYDYASAVLYKVISTHWRLNRDYKAVIAIARSLYD